MNGFIYALGGTGFTFAMTVLGAGVVFFFRSDSHSDKAQSAFLGFASGVMIAASVWSLLIPAIEEAERLGRVGWVPAAFGFMLGVLFLMALDKLIPSGACSTGAEQKTITVTAHSRVTVVPDVARITVSVVTEGKDAASAQKANGKPTTAVIEALKGLGVAAEDIQTTYADLSPIWNDEGETSRYEMRTMLSVDGLPIESVSQAMEACVDAGASEVSGIEYYASTYDEAYEEALWCCRRGGQAQGRGHRYRRRRLPRPDRLGHRGLSGHVARRHAGDATRKRRGEGDRRRRSCQRRAWPGHRRGGGYRLVRPALGGGATQASAPWSASRHWSVAK